MNTFVKAAFFGVIAGMRSMAAPAFLSADLSQSRAAKFPTFGAGFLSDRRVSAMLKVAAAGEFFADKLPFVPDRISPGPLAARAISGAFCGASLCRAEGESAAAGAVAGGLSAIGSAYAFYHLRRRLSESTVIPDPLLGLAEDALVVIVGRQLSTADFDRRNV